MDDNSNEGQQEQSPKRPGRRESAGVVAPIGAPGRRQSQGHAVSMAPPSRKKHQAAPQKPDSAQLDTSNATQDAGNESLKPPTREVENPFGVEDIAHKIIREGTLGINVMKKRYFVLYGNGTLHMFKSAAEKEKSNTAQELTERLLTVTVSTAKKLKGHWITFHFDSGSCRNYRTTGEKDQEEWIHAGHLIKSQ